MATKPKKQKVLIDDVVAKHWGVARPYLTQLRQKKGMPKFQTLDEADNWRAANQQRRPRSQNPNTTTAPAGFLGELSKIAPKPPDPNRSFEEEMVERAQSVAQMAHEAYEISVRAGQFAAVSMAIKNWTEAAKAASEARARYIELLEKNGTLIPVDKALSIFGDKLQALRVRLLKMGERIGTRANPQDPLSAKQVIDEEVDEIFRQMATDVERADGEIREKEEA